MKPPSRSREYYKCASVGTVIRNNAASFPFECADYSSAGSQGNALRQAWQSRFPGVPLNLTVDLSKYLDNEIDRAFYDNRTIYDVAVLQSLQDYPRWKTANRLLYYKPPNFADLLEGEKDFQGAWLPVQIGTNFDAKTCVAPH